MSHDITPVERRRFESVDSEATVLHTHYDDVSFTRGLGDSGKRVETVEHECIDCGCDRTIRLVQVNPVTHYGVQYWCTNPGCRYFVRDQLTWATGASAKHAPKYPLLYSQTVVCPDCGDTHVINMARRLEDEYDTTEDGDYLALCSDCEANRAELRAGV